MLTLLPDLNFAALKYAYVLDKHGGPISSVSYLEHDGTFEGFAYLAPSTGAKAKARQFAATKAEAINGAISEALKAWAHGQALQRPDLRIDLMLDLDPSPRGFAAYPGLGPQGAMKRALFDAARSWTIATWLLGAHTHSELGGDGSPAILVKGPIRGLAVVLVWRDTFYASAAGTTQAHALDAAKFRLLLAEQDGKSAHHARVQERLKSQGKLIAAPALAVDAAARGPWTQYTHVWRCLFDSFPKSEKDNGDGHLF